MDPPTSLDDIDIHSQHEEDVSAEGVFNAEWELADTTHLQPANLPIARVQRAWERKPLSPFSRRKVRVGKVWKRAAITSRPAVTSADATMQAEGRGAKRTRTRASLQSPLKPVKKFRMDSDYGIGARLSQWGVRESPARKIVTRSARGEELVALPDTEEQEVEEDESVTIEIFDEEGKAVDADATGLEVQHEWSDVEDADESAGEEGFDDTMMNLDVDVLRSLPAPWAESCTSEDSYFQRPGIETHGSGTPITRITHENSIVIAVTAPDLPYPVFLPPIPKVALPEGFVSPVKQRRKLGPRSSRAVSESRRKTLPAQFAPALLAEQHAEVATAEDGGMSRKLEPAGSPEAVEQDLPTSGADNREDVSAPEEDVWEDVEEEALEGEIAPEETLQATANEHPSQLGAQLPDMSDEPLSIDETAEPYSNAKSSHHSTFDPGDKLASSPVASIEGPHPRLPLRRSPRRKSSSPLKQNVKAPSTEKPHHVAFTPLKRFSPFVDLRHTAAATPDQNDHDDDIQQDTSEAPRISPRKTTKPRVSDDTALSNSRLNCAAAQTNDEPSEQPDDDSQPVASPFQRASSAPLEEPQMSPRKPTKPRVSDDTALLHAFIARAAESKSSRRLSITGKESLSNRRDSDTIRQALASPAKPDVLMDLDPNTPSPRKQQSGIASPAPTVDTAMTTTTPNVEDVEQDAIEDATEQATGMRTRRSGRGRKKPQVYSQSNPSSAASSAPSKITIRGPNANNVDVKRSEAQELALVTRNNTRKNKGGSILPKSRLVKMAVDSVSAAATGQAGEVANSAEGHLVDEEMTDTTEGGRRRIKWAETLVSFYQGPAEPDTSLLSDESEERMPWERGADFDPTAEQGVENVAAPPPAAETPSKPKPKIRRLKPPRTASTPAPDAARMEPTIEESVTPAAATDADVNQKAAPKPRRSRIATPAKGLTNASLLPADLAPEPAPTMTAVKKFAAKKRAVTSRLLPPRTISSGAAPARAAAAGKENLISSPPKKRSAAPTTGLPSAKSMASKLDFGKAADLKMSINADGDTAGVPGLASPAKKGGCKVPALSSGSRNGTGDKDQSMPPPGLSSPAKKRTTRRAVT